jgi:hypothetical protein
VNPGAVRPTRAALAGPATSTMAASHTVQTLIQPDMGNAPEARRP